MAVESRQEPRRMPPGEPGDDIRSDPIALSQTGRPYFRSMRVRGTSSTVVIITLIAAILAVAAIVYGLA